MSEPTPTTPVQPVRPAGSSGRGAVGVGLVLVVVVGLLAWHPWSASNQRSQGLPAIPSAEPATAQPTGASVDDFGSFALGAMAGSVAGPWSGRVAAEWSIVAFLRADPVSRDPLSLRQEPVAVFVGAAGEPTGGPEATCEARPTPATPQGRAAADLPTREVRFLGVAYPADRQAIVEQVVRIGDDLTAIPVELGRIPGVGAEADGSRTPAPTTASPRSAASGEPGIDRVQMFGLVGGGPWPDGAYRFDVSSEGSPPAHLFACIRP